MGGRKYTNDQIAFLYSCCHLPSKEMAEKLNDKFELNKTPKNMRDWCFRNKTPKRKNITIFKKGHKPWNKGSDIHFSRSSELGHERVNCDGHVLIKTDSHRRMVKKHRHVWEENNGEIPNGYIVTFKNGITTDCSIENLILLSRSELVRLNQSYIKHSTPETHESCILLAKIKDKTNKLKVA